MRKIILVLAAVAALAIPTVAVAVDLHEPHIGTACEFGGTFHFVANGVNGATGSLTATWDQGGGSLASYVSGTAHKVNKGTNHWWVDAYGTLVSASATVGDKLVLSDYTCWEKKD